MLNMLVIVLVMKSLNMKVFCQICMPHQNIHCTNTRLVWLAFHADSNIMKFGLEIDLSKGKLKIVTSCLHLISAWRELQIIDPLGY